MSKNILIHKIYINTYEIHTKYIQNIYKCNNNNIIFIRKKNTSPLINALIIHKAIININQIKVKNLIEILLFKLNKKGVI
jgi:hypothetical protein